jgi:hypothetical protein
MGLEPTTFCMARAIRTPWGANPSATWSRVAPLLVPDGWAALRGEVEQVPDRLEGADVARILAGVGWCVEELRAPEVADRLAVAVEDVQYRPLVPSRRPRS